MANVVAPGLIVAGGVYLAAKVYQKPTAQGKRLARNKLWQKSMAKQEQAIESKHQPIIDAKNAIAANNAKMEEGIKEAKPLPNVDRFGLIQKWNDPQKEKPVANTSGHRNKAGAGVPSKPAANPQPNTRKDIPMNWNTMIKYSAFNGRKTQYATFSKAAKRGRQFEKKGDKIRFMEWDEVNNKKVWTDWVTRTKAHDKMLAYAFKYRNQWGDLYRSIVVKGWWDDNVILDFIQHEENAKSGIKQYDTENRDDSIQHMKDKQFWMDAARKPVPPEQPGPQAEDGSQWQPWKCSGPALKDPNATVAQVRAAQRARRTCLATHGRVPASVPTSGTYLGMDQKTPLQAAAAKGRMTKRF